MFGLINTGFLYPSNLLNYFWNNSIILQTAITTTAKTRISPKLLLTIIPPLELSFTYLVSQIFSEFVRDEDPKQNAKY